MYISQVLNGVLLPFILIIMLLLAVATVTAFGLGYDSLWNWRALFVLGVPLGLLAAALAWRYCS